MFIMPKYSPRPQRLRPLPKKFAHLRRLCTCHPIPVAADFHGFVPSTKLPISAPPQMVAIYRCRLCGRSEAVGQHFTTGQPIHVGDEILKALGQFNVTDIRHEIRRCLLIEFATAQ